MKIKYLNQKGVIPQILILLLLLGGISGGLILLKNPQIFKSKASNPPIVFKSATGQALPKNSQGIEVTQSPSIKVELTSTLGAPVFATPVSTVTPTLQPTTTSAPLPASSNFCSACAADVTRDGIVDFTDLNLGLDCNSKDGHKFTDTVRGMQCSKLDINKDGVVDQKDIDCIDSKMQQKCNAGIGTTAPVLGTSTSAPNSPAQISGTISYKIAESPTGLDTTVAVAYTANPTTIDYTFKDKTPGVKFIWVEFKDVSGKTDRRSAQVQLAAGSFSSRELSCGNFGDIDKDGKITDKDSDLIVRYTAGKFPMDDAMKKIADVTGDGVVDQADVVEINQYIVGDSKKLKICNTVSQGSTTTTFPSLLPCGNYGDLNGDGKITDDDATLVLKIVAGDTSITADQRIRADVNGDGQVNSIDALKIKRFVAGKDQTFAVCKKTPAPTPTPRPTLKPGDIGLGLTPFPLQMTAYTGGTSVNPATLTCLTTSGCNFSLYTSGFPSGGSIVYSPKSMKYGESQSIGVKTLYTSPGVYNITVTLVSNTKSVAVPFTLTVLK